MVFTTIRSTGEGVSINLAGPDRLSASSRRGQRSSGCTPGASYAPDRQSCTSSSSICSGTPVPSAFTTIQPGRRGDPKNEHGETSSNGTTPQCVRSSRATGASKIDTAGDGFFATFDGPARGVRCAQQILEAVTPLGVQVRAGVHTGEVQTIAGKAGGLGVVIGARVGALAGGSEVFVSQTVKDLRRR
jgi:hypothetical protein